MAPFRSGRCGSAVLDPDVESPRGCEPVRIRLPAALDRERRRRGGERDHRLDAPGAVAARPLADGRSRAGLGRRRARVCTRRYLGPRPVELIRATKNPAGPRTIAGRSTFRAPVIFPWIRT